MTYADVISATHVQSMSILSMRWALVIDTTPWHGLTQARGVRHGTWSREPIHKPKSRTLLHSLTCSGREGRCRRRPSGAESCKGERTFFLCWGVSMGLLQGKA